MPRRTNYLVLRCPDCHGEMHLLVSDYKYKDNTKRYVYKCLKCNNTHAAHPDGTPCGIPANKRTRRLRGAVHDLFDRLWRAELGGWMTRTEAYRILPDILDKPNEIHISDMNEEDCKKAIVKLKEFLIGHNKDVSSWVVGLDAI